MVGITLSFTSPGNTLGTDKMDFFLNFVMHLLCSLCIFDQIPSRCPMHHNNNNKKIRMCEQPTICDIICFDIISLGHQWF